MTAGTAVFTCSICGEPSSEICTYCTKDACRNHRCARCKRCSDCCECEEPLSAAEVEEPVVAEAPAAAPAEAPPEAIEAPPPVEVTPPIPEEIVGDDHTRDPDPEEGIIQ